MNNALATRIVVRSGDEYLYQAPYGPEWTMVPGRAYVYDDLAIAQSDARQFGGCVEITYQEAA